MPVERGYRFEGHVIDPVVGGVDGGNGDPKFDECDRYRTVQVIPPENW
ncbi:MAG: hypothetical protein AAF268_08560 [Cyanobacteria bacterium P01_A01_bin.3]